MHILAITLLSSSEGRLEKNKNLVVVEKNVRTKMAESEEQWLMQSRIVAASGGGGGGGGGSSVRRK